MFNFPYRLLRLYKRTLVFYIILFAFPLLLVLAYFFTVQPFRNDTKQYLAAKNNLKTSIMNQPTADNAKVALNQANQELIKIRCDKVDTVYRVECDRLKSDINQFLPLVESNDKSSRANYLANDIVNLLK